MRHKRVLVVEDDISTAAFLVACLRADGFDTLVVGDGLTALKAIANERPEAVVLDLTLPGISGLSILGSLRANPRTRTVPVVIVSEHTDRDTRWAARAAGCEEFLQKPVSASGLVEAVHRAISDARRPEAPRDGRGRWVRQSANA